MGKVQVILLTTTGRKTGRPQTVPLNGMPEGDGFVVIGWAGGSDFHPAWSLNLVANPHARIQVNNRSLMSGCSRSRIRPALGHVVASMRGYAVYQKKTTRLIPLGLLRPTPNQR